MRCRSVRFSGHALARMFERALSVDDVAGVVRNGTTIADYPDDRPYPSVLRLGFVGTTPVHAVVARTEDEDCVVVTAYVPGDALWTDGYTRRRDR